VFVIVLLQQGNRANGTLGPVDRWPVCTSSPLARRPVFAFSRRNVAVLLRKDEYVARLRTLVKQPASHTCRRSCRYRAAQKCCLKKIQIC